MRSSPTRRLPLGTFAPRGNFYLTEGSIYSVFGQAIWKITPKIELSGGARTSWERKAISLSTGTNIANLTPVAMAEPIVEGCFPGSSLTIQTYVIAFYNRFLPWHFNSVDSKFWVRGDFL